ncbi:MAG: VTT domain-containing protein, partial [Planctomycetota bacterium]
GPETLTSLFSSVGPVAVVVLLALAVVVSPIPSGPIAMAAGAMFGTLEGGALTALGAITGALIAFCLSRWFGYRPLSASSLGVAQWITQPRSDYRLAFIILVSRLIPFISFDVVSYVAGLTSIRLLSFAVATTLGVLPASFAFAALGAGMTTIEGVPLMIAACSVTVILPAAWVLLRSIRRPKI